MVPSLKEMLPTGVYLREIAPMATTEIVPLSKHLTSTFFITITSDKKIMIMQLIVAKILLLTEACVECVVK